MNNESIVKVMKATNPVTEKTAYINFQLSIQDFGAGIPSDKLDKLFINFGNLNEHLQQNQ